MIISGSVIAHKFFDNDAEVADNVSCQLPSIEFASSEVKGAGILGAMDMPSSGQLNSLNFSATMRSINKGSINVSTPGVHNIELRFSKDQFTGDGQSVPIGTKIFVKGVFKKFDPGKVEDGATMDGTIEYEALRYRIVIDGEEVLLVDKVNYIYKVNGVDYMEKIRAALN